MAVAVLEQPEGRADDGVEHRLDVVRRFADDAQDVGGGRLLLQRLLRLVEQPRVLDRDHRLVGEGLDQPRVVVGERPHVEVEGRDRAVHLVAQRHRGAEHGGVAAELARPFAQAFGHSFAVQQIGEEGRLARQQPCAGRCRPREQLAHRVERFTQARAPMDQAVVAERADRQVRTRQQARHAGADAFEHRLRIGHRAADDAQHLGAGRLALQRFLGLVEQPRILDGDGRLVGKAAQQIELACIENAGFGAVDGDAADPLAAAHHRHDRRGAHAARAHRCTDGGVEALVGFGVGHQLRLARAQLRRSGEVGDAQRKHALERGGAAFIAGAERGQLQPLAVDAVDMAGGGAGQALRVGDDGVEHRLHVAR